MTELDCSCNRLREAQEKAAKWDALVRDARRLQNALFLACLKIESLTGTCPLDMEGNSPCNCESVCASDTETAECWYLFFMEDAQ